jgi:hypothetical protein
VIAISERARVSMKQGCQVPKIKKKIGRKQFIKDQTIKQEKKEKLAKKILQNFLKFRKKIVHFA